MSEAITMDDQPIDATFFGEGKWLTDFITPDALEVQELYKGITNGLVSVEDKIAACHQWVASQLKYKKFIRGRIWIEGKNSTQSDLWNMPSVTARIGVGNCANKSFLLTSLLRNALPASQAHCVLGTLYNGKPGGHAWVSVKLGGIDYIVESTMASAKSLIPAYSVDRYEAVHLFNDESAYAIEGRTLLEPFTACFSTWLSDYLDFAYIEGRK